LTADIKGPERTQPEHIEQ